MSRKEKAAVSVTSRDNGGGDGTAVNSIDYLTTPPPTLSRLNPQDGALIKLDCVEQRLQAARAAGNDDAWGRYYLAWLKLHALAFSYGRWAEGAGR